MKTRLLLLIPFRFIVLAALQTTSAPAQPVHFVEGELLVKFRGGSRGEAAARVQAAMRHEVKRHFDFIGWQQVKLPAGMTTEEGLERYKNLPDVLAVEPNVLNRAIQPIGPGAAMLAPKSMSGSRPNDPLLAQQRALEKIGAPLAWGLTNGSTNVVVAVIDTGVNYLHEDLRDNMWRNPSEIPGNGIDDDGNGYVDDIYGIDTADDAFGNDSDPMDKGFNEFYHGSAVAGIIGATGHNGKGVAGLNWSIQIMALRWIRTNNMGTAADEIEAVNYVYWMKQHGVNVRVVNMSYGLDFSQASLNAHSALAALGVLHVAACGNDNTNRDVALDFTSGPYIPGVIAVAASDALDQLASFSDFGRLNVDLAAPGAGIVSTFGPETNRYAFDCVGTSFACPTVVGAAALLAAQYPNATAAEITQALLETVDVLPAFTNKMVSNGRLNIARAMYHRNFVTHAPPLIVAQPQSQSAPPGLAAALRVSVAGSEPLAFRWQHDGVDVALGTNGVLAFDTVTTNHVGEYRVVVSNNFGAVTSIVATLTVVPETATFSRVASGTIVTDAGKSIGAAWADYDLDGDLDLFVARGMTGENDVLYRNIGSGTFTNLTLSVPALQGGDSWGAAWGDFDNDGLPDLFVANGANLGNDNNFLFHTGGNGAFTRLATNNAGSIVGDGGASFSGSWVDYDRDGALDLFVCNGRAPGLHTNFLYHNNRDGRFTRVTTGTIATNPGSFFGSAWGDYDGDGFPDLFVANGFGRSSALYHNDGDGTFTRTTVLDGLLEPAATMGGTWGDFDNDGDLDLFVAQHGRSGLLRNDGGGAFTAVGAAAKVDDFNMSDGCSWVDYDNDGFLDLFVADETGSCLLYHNSGNGTFRRVTTGSIVTDIGAFTDCAWGDYDNDGFTDLFLCNFGRASLLYHNNGNSNRWITVNLIGTRSNRGGVGAKVRALANIHGAARWQMREISGGGSWGVASDGRAAFGLGDAGTVDTLRIEWPSGTVQELTGVAVNQFLTVTEASLGLIREPQDLAVRLGASTNFTVVALSDQPPAALMYQWYSNGVALAGQTLSNLPIVNAQLSLEAGYSVVVSDGLRTTTSRVARLVVLVTPSVVQPPLSQSVVEGGNVTFSVGVSGWPAPFTYEWRKVSVGLVTNTHSFVMDFMTLTNVSSSAAGNYRVIIKNAASPTGVATALAMLTVLPDSDHDGLPDSWETSFGLTAPNADDDGDGVSNQSEYLAGTNPTNAFDSLRVDRIVGGPDGVRLEFSAQSNRTYTVEGAERPEPGAWSKVTDVLARPTNRLETVIDAVPGAQRYYRIMTPRRP